MTNLPGGTITISGHVGQSLKMLPARWAELMQADDASVIASTAMVNGGIPRMVAKGRDKDCAVEVFLCRDNIDYPPLSPSLWFSITRTNSGFSTHTSAEV
jgi:hypothetical protein